jgi:hypothetical protein
VAHDVDGRVEIANGTASAALGLEEQELLGRDWFALTGVSGEAWPRFLAGAIVSLPSTPGVTWRWSLSRDADGRPLGALGWGEPLRLAGAVAASARR